LNWGAKPANAPFIDCWGSNAQSQNCMDLCQDINPNDSVLECDLPLPSNSSGFEFTIHQMPNGFWWGDKAYYDQGGCGDLQGTVTLSTANQSVTYIVISNNPNAPKVEDLNAQFVNGYVVNVP